MLKERVPRLIRMLVPDWAQKIFLCPIGGHHQSHCFLEFLIRRSLPADSTVLHTCPTRAGELSSRRVFRENGSHKTEDIE